MSARKCFAATSGRVRALLAVAAVIALASGQAADNGQGDASGPAASPLPPWAVLVLQPVGDKRVRPVTGVVVTSGGTVLVPADFAAEGDVLIVLDGGTDIIEHGRPATVRARDAAAGITLLDVPGLARQPVRFAAESTPADEKLLLVAFPPAEQIAAGAAPLRVETRAGDLVAAAAGGATPANRPPNVSGPLVDACGLLAGYSLAAGVPGLTPDAGTAYAWSGVLVTALNGLGIEAETASCAGAQAVEADSSADEPAGAVPAAALAATPVAPDVGRTDEPASEAQSEGAARPYGWIALVLVMLAAGFAVWRFSRARRTDRPGLLQDRAVGRARRRADTATAADQPTQGWQLEIAGQLPSGATFTRRCGINPAAIDAVIGSGLADIVIDAPAVAGEHVRLGGRAGAVTLCGLAAAAGTWINRVPCSRGEIMFLAEGDTVVLGETSFRARLLAPGAGGNSRD